MHNATESPRTDEISSEDWNRLLEIAAIARKNKHMEPQRTERLILQLCHGNWLTRRQLPELLRRDDEGLRCRFLSPMVKRGALCLKYPDKPRRVDQAYTADNGVVNDLFIDKDRQQAYDACL